MGDSFTRNLQQDFVKLMRIFTRATFELVTLRNSSRAPPEPGKLFTSQRSNEGSVWIQISPKKLRIAQSKNKDATPAIYPIKRLWDALKPSSNPFDALYEEYRDASHNCGPNTTEKYRVQSGITIEIDITCAQSSITIHQGDDLDGHIQARNCTSFILPN